MIRYMYIENCTTFMKTLYKIFQLGIQHVFLSITFELVGDLPKLRIFFFCEQPYKQIRILISHAVPK